MKFSPQTLAVLKNFSGINQNVFLRKGNVISTINTGKSIFATATIAEEIPSDVPVYDLGSLLALLSLTDSPEIEFGEKSLIISKDGAEFEFFYSDPEILVFPPKKEINFPGFFTFTLSKDDVTTILKAAAVMSAPTMSIVSKSGKVMVKVGDPKVAASNSYKKVVGESDAEFNVQIAVEMLKIIPENYEVSLTKQKFINFKNTERGLVYWLAAAPQSVV